MNSPRVYKPAYDFELNHYRELYYGDTFFETYKGVSLHGNRFFGEGKIKRPVKTSTYKRTMDFTKSK